MKKIFIYTLLLFVVVSCDSGFLTRNDPTSTTDKKWWKTQNELTNALNTIYDRLPSGALEYYSNDRNAFIGLTDNAYWNNNFYGIVNTFARGNGSPTASAGQYGFNFLGIWGDDYDRIRLASRFINLAGKAYVKESLKKRYIAEARALRAWYHLELFLYWRNIPIISSPVTADQAPKMTNNASPKEIVNFIAGQLDSAAANLPYSYPNNEAWRITKGACFSMKAVAYLNNHMYKKAAQSAKRVINLKNSSGQKVYKLHYSNDPNTNNYADLFTYNGQINKERIFFDNTGAGEIWFRNAPTGISPGPQQGGLNPTASLVNAYETKQGKILAQMSPDSAKIYKEHPNYHNNRDPRFKATILYPGQTFADDHLEPFSDDPNNPDRIGVATGSATGFWDRKYLTEHDRGQSGSLDYMIIRYSQILLIQVEALVEGGNWQNPDVIRDLNKIRERAGMPDVDVNTYNTQDKVRKLYRRERRVELALESWRWFDIRRWNIGKKVMDSKVYGAINPATGEPVQVITRHYNPNKDDLWPIPKNDIESSSLKQNPGY